MQAMVYRGPYKLRVEEKEIPPIEHPNDAIVRVTLAAICGSDLHLYHGMMPDTRVGMTFGHRLRRKEGPVIRHDVKRSLRTAEESADGSTEEPLSSPTPGGGFSTCFRYCRATGATVAQSASDAEDP